MQFCVYNYVDLYTDMVIRKNIIIINYITNSKQ